MSHHSDHSYSDSSRRTQNNIPIDVEHPVQQYHDVQQLVPPQFHDHTRPDSSHSEVYYLETASTAGYDNPEHNEQHEQYEQHHLQYEHHVQPEHPEQKYEYNEHLEQKYEYSEHPEHHDNQQYPKHMEDHEQETEQHEQYSREELESPSNTYANTSEHHPHHQQEHYPLTRGERFRSWVINSATVLRLQILWGLLALFGTMSWLSLMPAYAFSWIFLAANKDGAKTNCHEGPLSQHSGYAMQCRGVNVAIIFDVIVFLLWTPIAMIIVCGTIDRGLWWGRKRENKEQDFSQDEYDLKSGNYHGQNRSLDNISQYDQVQAPNLAYITPIASQFKATEEQIRYEHEEDYEINTPANQQRPNEQVQPQQQPQPQLYGRQQIQYPQKLRHKASNTSLAPSLSARLSGFFGAGWNSGPMPPPPPPPEPVPVIPSQYRAGSQDEQFKPSLDASRNQEPDKTSLNGDAYVSQWHSRRRDDEWS
ncbi:hypothetical protein BGZ49_007352 [Haplosporangium sp. Z 27]|nr:hypothetical protein BGZ49_007352 [Haplosporangium sp. Z 27]